MAQIQTVTDAVLRATRPGEKAAFAQVCGVFGPDGQPIPAARITTHVGSACLPCRCPDPANLPRRKGRWLYGGIGFHHFGHALIYATARLWALDAMADPPDGILYLDRGTGGLTRPGTTRNLQALLALLGIDLPVVTVGQDERVDQLLVPEEGISTAPDLFDGTDAYRAFIRSRTARSPGTGTHRSVYVSRSRLGLHRAGLMFEDRIEALLSAAGYHIFHPERSPLAEQIATYRGADRIIGIDGSAMHLVAFAAEPHARVAVLGRRPFYPQAMAAQIGHLSGAAAKALQPWSGVFVGAEGATAPDPWFWTHCLPDFPALGQALHAAGLLDRAPADWTAPDLQTVQDRLDQIAQRNRTTLTALSPRLAL